MAAEDSMFMRAGVWSANHLDSLRNQVLKLVEAVV
jgi:hypothetical protein